MRLYKNVDIKDLESILEKGILSMEESGNDNWEDGYRSDNARDVVYLFKPTGKQNSFCQYGAALLEVDVESAKQNEMSDGDVNEGKYEEYIIDRVEPEQIVAVYIPEIFKEKADIPEVIEKKISWCEFAADGYTDKGFGPCQDEMLRRFAETAKVNDSSLYNYFRGEHEDRSVMDLYNTVYKI